MSLSFTSNIWSSIALPDQDLMLTKPPQLLCSVKYKPLQDVKFLHGLFSQNTERHLKYSKVPKLLTNFFWASGIIPWRPVCFKFKKSVLQNGSDSLHTHQVHEAMKHWDVIGKVLKKHKHQRQKACIPVGMNEKWLLFNFFFWSP